nr:uncharacterized protein LOC109148618 [Ipomoea trifida]
MAPKTRRAKQKAQSSSPAIPPKFGSGQLNITEKDFAKRYLLFQKKPILPLLLIDLEALKPFGLDKAVDNLIVSPEWRHLLFDFKEDIHIDLVHEVMATLKVHQLYNVPSAAPAISFRLGSQNMNFTMDELSKLLNFDEFQGYSQDQEAKVERLTFLRNEKEFKDEIAIAQGSLKPSQAAHNSTVTFIKEEYEVIQYVLSRSICGRKSGSKTRRAKQKAQSSSPAIPPKFGSGQLNITEKDFAKRYLLFQKKPILPLLLIDLEPLKPFGLDKAVDNLIVSPEWRHLLFDFKEDIHIDLVHEVMATLKVHQLYNVASAAPAISFRLGSQNMNFTMDELSKLLNFDEFQGYSQDQEAKVERLTFLRNEKEFKDEIAIAQGSLKPSQAAHNSTVTFIKEEYEVIQYVLSRSICGRKSGSKTRRAKQKAQSSSPAIPPKFGSGQLNITAKDFAKRYLQFQKKPILPLLLIDLEALKPFGLDKAVDNLIVSPEWRHLLFDFKEDIHIDLVHEVMATLKVHQLYNVPSAAPAISFRLGSQNMNFTMDELSKLLNFDEFQGYSQDQEAKVERLTFLRNEKEFKDEIAIAQGSLKPSQAAHNSTVTFIKEEYKVIQYVLSRSICGRKSGSKTRRAKQKAQSSSPAIPPKFGSGQLNITAKDFAKRYLQFQKKPILPLLLIDLEALKPFGLDKAVDNLIVSPEWRHLLFDFKEDIHIDLVHEVMATLKVHQLYNVPSAAPAISFRLGSQNMNFTMDELSKLLNFDEFQGYSQDQEAKVERLTFLRNEKEFKDEIAIAQGSLKPSQAAHNSTVTFIKEEYKVIQYVLSRSICGRKSGSKTRRAKQKAQSSSPAIPPKFGSGQLNITEKDFAKRYLQFQKKPILPLLLIDLEALKPFGLDKAVDNLIVSPKWRHLLFDFKEDIHIDLVHEVMATLKVHQLYNVPSAAPAISFRLGSQNMNFTMDELSKLLNFDEFQGYSQDQEAKVERLTFLRNEKEFKDEIAIAQGSLKPSQAAHNSTVTFIKEEYKVIQYVLSRSICGRKSGSKTRRAKQKAQSSSPAIPPKFGSGQLNITEKDFAKRYLQFQKKPILLLLIDLEALKPFGLDKAVDNLIVSPEWRHLLFDFKEDIHIDLVHEVMATLKVHQLYNVPSAAPAISFRLGSQNMNFTMDELSKLLNFDEFQGYSQDQEAKVERLTFLRNEKEFKDEIAIAQGSLKPSQAAHNSTVTFIKEEYKVIQYVLSRSICGRKSGSKTRRAKQKAQSSSPAIPPKFGSGQLNITEKDFAKRYLQFQKKPILPLLLIDLEALKPFGLDKAVDNLIVHQLYNVPTAAPAISFRLGSQNMNFTMDELSKLLNFDEFQGYSQDQEAKVERLTFLRNEKEFKDEIAIAQGSLKPSQAAHNSTVTFIKEEYKVIQYVLSRSICGEIVVNPQNSSNLYHVFSWENPSQTLVSALLNENYHPWERALCFGARIEKCERCWVIYEDFKVGLEELEDMHGTRIEPVVPCGHVGIWEKLIKAKE